MEGPGKRAGAMDDGDRLSDLPDELLHSVLSFLPARDAVRTIVLAPRWRHLWASARRLNIGTTGFTSIARFTLFVCTLLLHRGNAPLDTFWLRADGPHILLDDSRNIANLWIYYALRCNVQELGIVDYKQEDEEESDREEIPCTFYPDSYYFRSSHLKRLHLCFVGVDNRFIEQLFSGCPVLEDLEMIDCDITATQFSSTTLKSLNINSVGYSINYEEFVDIVIDMPSLVSLDIGSLVSSKPCFMNLQSLLTAIILIDQRWLKFSVGCYILRAFSNVKDLMLLPYDNMLQEKYLGDDMLFCQVMFTNLTTLTLGDLYLHHSCQALLYVLKQSPNLEKLTLMLSEIGALTYKACPNDTMQLEPPREQTVTPFNCKKLKIIVIFCEKHDIRVGAVVAILCANLISLPEIYINPLRSRLAILQD